MVDDAVIIFIATQLGIVGLMNTFAIEGQTKNVFCNAIAPVALTRMTEGLMPQIDDGVKQNLRRSG